LDDPDIKWAEKRRKNPLRRQPLSNEPYHRPIPNEVSIGAVTEGTRFPSPYKKRGSRHTVNVTLNCVWYEFDGFYIKPTLREGQDVRQVSRKWIEGQAKREPATLYYVRQKDSFLVFKKSDALQRMFLFEGAIPVITYLPRNYFTEESCRKRRETTSNRAG
jgi:hypothetical protein